MSQIFRSVGLLELGICEASFFAWSLGEVIQRHARICENPESFTRSVATMRRIGSIAAQSLTCIPASRLLFEPERGKHPSRRVYAGDDLVLTSRTPRAGLDPAVVVASAAGLADDVGRTNVTMGLLGERLGVRAPSGHGLPASRGPADPDGERHRAALHGHHDDQ